MAGDIDTWKSVGLGALSALGAVAGGGGLWRYLSDRARAREKAPREKVDADKVLINAAGSFAKAVAESTSGMIADMRGRIDALELKVEACEEHRATCEAEVAELKIEIAALRGEGARA